MSNRRTSTRLLTRTLIIALLLAVLLVAVAPAAFAQGTPPCFQSQQGNSCNGLSPQATGCNAGATTIHSVSNKYMKVDLRYSPWCHAYWSRVTNRKPALVNETHAWIKGHKPATEMFVDSPAQAISNMWWSPPRRACGFGYEDFWVATPVICTP